MKKLIERLRNAADEVEAIHHGFTCHEAAAALEAMSAVVDAARKCKNGCRRCNAFDRYVVLKDALTALDGEGK